MSMSYFAHAAYGVLMPEKEQVKIEEWVKSYREDGYVGEESLEGFLSRVSPGLLEELKNHYGAPEEAHLCYTGDEDDRPGECDCDPECWLLAIGYPAFPLQGTISEAFKAKASWFSWVSCS
jgi:hypothetical protein